MSLDDPPFESIAIVGLGLIGGSIALGVRERWPESRVVGGGSEAGRAHALGAGAIERGFDSVGVLPDTSLIVLAAPVRQNIELLQQIKRPAIATDVSGTKRDIVSAARALSPGTTFVGGHPLGGRERGGFWVAGRGV